MKITQTKPLKQRYYSIFCRFYSHKPLIFYPYLKLLNNINTLCWFNIIRMMILSGHRNFRSWGNHIYIRLYNFTIGILLLLIYLFICTFEHLFSGRENWTQDILVAFHFRKDWYVKKNFCSSNLGFFFNIQSLQFSHLRKTILLLIGEFFLLILNCGYLLICSIFDQFLVLVIFFNFVCVCVFGCLFLN